MTNFRIYLCLSAHVGVHTHGDQTLILGSVLMIIPTLFNSLSEPGAHVLAGLAS